MHFVLRRPKRNRLGQEDSRRQTLECRVLARDRRASKWVSSIKVWAGSPSAVMAFNPSLLAFWEWRPGSLGELEPCWVTLAQAAPQQETTSNLEEAAAALWAPSGQVTLGG